MRSRAALVLITLAAWQAAASADVTIRVDAAAHQTIEGFGATTISLIFGAVDNVPAALRAQAIDALYNQVRLNMGNLEIGPFEGPATSLYAPANDDNDPALFTAGGFNWTQSDNMMNGVVLPAQGFGFDNYYLGPVISETYEFAWARALRGTDYSRYLDECAEHVAAVAIHWRDAYGITPRLMQLFNEPLSGNGELVGGSRQEIVDIVKRAGARLRQEGFSTMRFVVPAEETEQVSLDDARAILADPVARQFVGAIAYHPYPYGSTYASVPNILATSGVGNPDAGKVSLRNQLRDLGAQYGVPVFMVEVSHSDVGFGVFDGMRGRAIHIHDEMVHANASAYFGMNAMWDSVSNDQHFAGRPNPGLFAETDSIVLIDDAAGQVYITEMGRAIGHYARFVPRGSVRLEATSDDPLVQITAFLVDVQARLVLVAINNANAPRTVQVSLTGIVLSSASPISGEQSTAAAYWQAIPSLTPSATGFTAVVPPLSVTSFVGGLAGASPTDAGVAMADGGASEPDAAVAVADGGVAAADAGVVAADAGVVAADAGVVAADAGVAAADAAVAEPPMDTGVAPDAAAPTLQGGMGGGCSCLASNYGPGPVAALLLVAVIARPRRRQSR